MPSNVTDLRTLLIHATNFGAIILQYINLFNWLKFVRRESNLNITIKSIQLLIISVSLTSNVYELRFKWIDLKLVLILKIICKADGIEV